MMDDLTYLAMNCFKKINTEYENILIVTSFTSHVYCCLIFKNILNVGITLAQNYCSEKKWHKKRRREKVGEGVPKSYFFLILLFTKY